MLITEYTDMSMSQVLQRQSIHYSGALPVLQLLLSQVSGNVEMLEGNKMRVFQNVDITLDNKIVMLEVYTLLSFFLSTPVTVP
jgi:cleavage and polyadenylation specificity factor subunit 3